MKTIIATRAARHPLRRRVEKTGETLYGTSRSVSWVHDGERVGNVEIRVDIERLALLYGSRALGNKARRAIFGSGCVEVLAVKSSIRDNRLRCPVCLDAACETKSPECGK